MKVKCWAIKPYMMSMDSVVGFILDRWPRFREAREERNKIKEIYLENITHLRTPQPDARMRTIAFPMTPGFKTYHLGNKLQERQREIKECAAMFQADTWGVTPLTDTFQEKWYRGDEEVDYYIIPPDFQDSTVELMEEMIDGIERKNRHSKLIESFTYGTVLVGIALVLTMPCILAEYFI